MLTKHKGFTVLELLFVMAIMIPALLGIIGVNLFAIRAGESARQITKAIQDANTTIERIRDTSKQSLAQVTSTYPNGQTVSGFSNLTSEQVVVTYANTSADPLAVTVTVTWSDRGRTMSRALTTQVTKRQ